MKRKKVLSFSLLILSLIFFTSCGKVTAYGLYSDAMQKLEKSSGFELEKTEKVVMDIDGQNLDIDIKSDTKFVKKGDSDTEMSSDSVTTNLGIDNKTELYYTGGNLYVNSPEKKVKYSLSSDDAKDTYGILMASLSKDQIKSSKMEENDNGYKVTYVLDQTRVNTVIDKITASQKEFLQSLSSEDEQLSTSGDITLECTFNKDKSLSSQKMTFSTTTTIASTPVKMNYTIINDVKSTKDVSVTLPDNLNEYKETTANNG